MKGEIICGYRLLCELGSRALPAYAAIDPKPRRPSEALCVVEPLTREGGVAAEAAAEFLREAKRVATLRHPNVASVRDVVVGASTVMLVSDWIDGEVLSDIELRSAEKSIPIPLAGSLRIVVDILEGLSALHELRDAKREPLRLVHAEVAPRNIVVGSDGRSVLVHPLRAPAGVSRAHSPEVLGYLAPEVLLGDQTADQRADVYGCGVLLWEALMGQRMHAEGEDTGEIVMRLLGGKIDPPCAPVAAPWAAPLAAAAKKAVAPDPSVRFANATEMLNEVRKVAGAHLAPKLAVAALVEAVVGEEIRARADRLGAPRAAARLPSESAWTTDRAVTRDPDASAQSPLVSAGSEADPEITRPPPLLASSRAAAGIEGMPSSARWQRDDAPMPVPVRAPSESSIEVSMDPAPTPSAISLSSSALIPTRQSEPPLSADVLEVVDVHVASGRPSGSRRPPPLRPLHARSSSPGEADIDPFAIPGPPLPPRIETPFAQTKPRPLAPTTASRAAAPARTWTVVGAFAVTAGAVLWILSRAPSVSPETVPAAAPPAASVEASPSAGSPPPESPSPPPAAPATTAAANEPSPFDPQPADDPAASAGAPSAPAVAATKPAHAVVPAAAPAAVHAPVVSSPAAAPPPAPAPTPAAPAPAPHPKKRTFDPMGI